MAYLITRIPRGGAPVTTTCSPEQAAAMRCMLFASGAVGTATRLHGGPRSTWEFNLPKTDLIRIAFLDPHQDSSA